MASTTSSTSTTSTTSTIAPDVVGTTASVPRTPSRSVSLAPPKQRDGPFGIARPLAALGLDLDPFLMVDWFVGDQDPFGPHPHAGFSAVSWILPDSPGRIRNRDTLGDDSTFGAGELHWFEAAHGAMHNETPLGRVHGLQIFVNLPSSHKHAEPRTYRGTVDDIPVVGLPHDDGGESRVRVVVGSAFGHTSPVVPRTPNVAILDLDVDGAVVLPIPRGHQAFALVTGGAVDVAGAGVDDNVVALNDDGDHLTLVGKGHVVVFHGAPLREPLAVAGPFVMNTRAELKDAIHRYEHGEMGSLDPLP